jgi:hypothetical protein
MGSRYVREGRYVIRNKYAVLSVLKNRLIIGHINACEFFKINLYSSD